MGSIVEAALYDVVGKFFLLFVIMPRKARLSHFHHSTHSGDYRGNRKIAGMRVRGAFPLPIRIMDSHSDVNINRGGY